MPSSVIGGITSLIGGSKLASAEKRAAASQAQGYRIAREDLQPFRDAGVNALGNYSALLGLGTPEQYQSAFDAFKTSPGYQWQLGQGIDALDRSAASRGNLFSGNQLQAVQTYGQGLASQEFNNYLSRLGNLAGRGQNAAVGQGGYSIGEGNAIAGGTRGAANALVSGYVGANNAMQQGFENNLAMAGLAGSVLGGFL